MAPPMKRPSSMKKEGEDGEPEAKKRPAASGSVNKAINELKHGLRSSSSKKNPEDEDGVEEQSGGEDDAAHLRDKGKSVKFNLMRRSLPAHIIHLYDAEAGVQDAGDQPAVHETEEREILFERGETNVCRGQKALRAQIRQGVFRELPLC